MPLRSPTVSNGSANISIQNEDTGFKLHVNMHELKPEDHPDCRCRRDGWFHDYSHTEIDNSEALAERCIRCGHKIVFYKDKAGRIDNDRYLETHALWFLQPGHPFFDKYYPDAELPDMTQHKKKSFEEQQAEIAEAIAQDVTERKRNRQTFTGAKLI